MIEKLLLDNPLSLKRYRRFKKNKIAAVSCWLLALLFFISFTAEFWANDRPHILYYQNKVYVPLLKNYHPSEFGRHDILIMDYRSLEMGPHDMAIWPLIQWNPFESNKNVADYPSPPTRHNLFGTDDSGRDVLTRLIYGLRYTLLYSVGVWLISYLIGSFIGASMGYWGGKIDLIGMRLLEIVESLPVFFVLITINSIFTPNIFTLVLFSSLFGWTSISIYMRAQFISLRNREFVDAARALGASHSRVILKHIFPNSITPIVTFAPFTIAANVYYLSIMDYLGMGLRAPTPSWGELFGQAQKWFTTAEWLVWAPSASLLITLTLLINIGQAVRDAYDSNMT